MSIPRVNVSLKFVSDLHGVSESILLVEKYPTSGKLWVVFSLSAAMNTTKPSADVYLYIAGFCLSPYELADRPLHLQIAPATRAMA